MNVLLISADLMTSSKVSGTCVAAGADPLDRRRCDRCRGQRLGRTIFDLAILDLASAGSTSSRPSCSSRRRLSSRRVSSPRPACMSSLLQTARDAGCDAVAHAANSMLSWTKSWPNRGSATEVLGRIFCLFRAFELSCFRKLRELRSNGSLKAGRIKIVAESKAAGIGRTLRTHSYSSRKHESSKARKMRSRHLGRMTGAGRGFRAWRAGSSRHCTGASSPSGSAIVGTPASSGADRRQAEFLGLHLRRKLRRSRCRRPADAAGDRMTRRGAEEERVHEAHSESAVRPRPRSRSPGAASGAASARAAASSTVCPTPAHAPGGQVSRRRWQSNQRRIPATVPSTPAKVAYHK